MKLDRRKDFNYILAFGGRCYHLVCKSGLVYSVKTHSTPNLRTPDRAICRMLLWGTWETEYYANGSERPLLMTEPPGGYDLCPFCDDVVDKINSMNYLAYVGMDWQGQSRAYIRSLYRL